MKALTNIKAVRAFACLLVVSVLTTTIASPLHLVFAAPTQQKNPPKTFPFDKKYENSVLKLMRDFIFDSLVLPKLNGAGCAFENVVEFGTNPKCFPESTADAKKKLTLATIQKNLFHEVYMGTTGKCGAHRDGPKGIYTIEQCIGYPWGVKKCTVMDGNISALGITIPQYCAKKSVSTATSGASKKPVNGIVDNLVNNVKNATSGGKSNKATQHEIRTYLTQVLNSKQIYKGSCKATTLAQFTTLPYCNPSALMNPDNYRVMKEVWRTLYIAAFYASGGRYGISPQNIVGREGTLFELGIIPNYNGDANNLVDSTKLFGVIPIPKTTTAQETKITIGLMNTVLACLAALFPIVGCILKLPDEWARGMLQIFVNKDVLSSDSDWKLMYRDVSIGELGIDLVANTLLVYVLQGTINNFITLSHAVHAFAKTRSFDLKASKALLAGKLIAMDTTIKISRIGPFVVAALTACKIVKQCDQPFIFATDPLVDDTKKSILIAGPVAIVFCLNKTLDLACVKKIIPTIIFEFTSGHFLFRPDGAVIRPPGPNHTNTRLGLSTMSAYGGVKFLEGVFKALSELSEKIKLLDINKLAGPFKGLGETIKRKWHWAVSGLFIMAQFHTLQNDLRAYNAFTQNSNCINSPSCSFDALKTAVTISNHPIPKAWNSAVSVINNIRISNVAVISGNTLTFPADTDLKLVGSLFSKIDRDKNTICKTYQPRKNLDAAFKEYLPTACKSASII